jgi:hypothetical protein
MAENVNRQANQKVLQEAAEVQDKTKEAIWRIQRNAAETEDVMTSTQEELARQGRQMVSSLNQISTIEHVSLSVCDIDSALNGCDALLITQCICESSTA